MATKKRAPHKYPGTLSTPLQRREGRGIVAKRAGVALLPQNPSLEDAKQYLDNAIIMEVRDHQRREELGLEISERMTLLRTHFEKLQGRSLNWFEVAYFLASEHVPGFRFAGKAGRPQKIHPVQAAAFRALVDGLRDGNGLTLKAALLEAARQKGEPDVKIGALRKRYAKAVVHRSGTTVTRKKG